MELISGEKGFELVHQSGNWILKKDIGFSPVEMLVASIGACGAYVYEKILTNSHIDFTIANVAISYERTEIQAKPLSKVVITFSVQISEEEHGKAERALKLIGKNCPVMQSLDPAITVVEEVVFI
ncbi:peroxiredoxin [Enterococcus ureilyticus]|uniref:Peroxiredoxin n=1 Tax=Enterococcus ureilyticus TaxID=1131292 RepID=A0A1E5H5M3_9ENTE|nr:OsmC family protein [Enterococcus ureilyticus]MBM7688962.1 putative OsmC-like protein [Enterococcus ureilyticus]MBO0446088.1 OsmC family protein [Enterococcus ureilyticus]OEG20234.1 peroxiredoxin [Enterococcus ureilyticus]